MCYYVMGEFCNVVIYKTGFELDDWIYWHLIHTTRGYK
jgi:hypothetical protein